MKGTARGYLLEPMTVDEKKCRPCQVEKAVESFMMDFSLSLTLRNFFLPFFKSFPPF
jgi:hypothetical protein